jgi:hypothetical protein
MSSNGALNRASKAVLDNRSGTERERRIIIIVNAFAQAMEEVCIFARKYLDRYRSAHSSSRDQISAESFLSI